MRFPLITKLNEDQRRVAKNAVMVALEEGPFPMTYRHLSGVARRAAEGFCPELKGRATDADRMADQVLQAERRAGRIIQKGRGFWWPAD